MILVIRCGSIANYASCRPRRKTNGKLPSMKLNRIKRAAPGALCFCCALFFQVGFTRGLQAETGAYDTVVTRADAAIVLYNTEP